MSIIKITKSGAVISGSKKDLTNLRNEFNKYHCIKLPRLLEDKLLKSIQDQLDQDEFYEDKYKVGKEKAIGYLPKNKSVASLLHFLVNDQELFRIIQKIVSCSHIGCFTGRVYSKIPNLGQYDSWHDDLYDNRMISMSINLSKDIYKGGLLQIFDCKSKKIVHEVANTGFGDAIIFRISPHLKHPVTKVTGKVPRTPFTGWFRSKPDYKPIFKPGTKIKKHNLKNGRNIESLIDLKHLRFIRRKELVYRNYDNRTLIFNPENTLCYGVNNIGSRIITLLQRSMIFTKILDKIHREYNVESDKCEQDILALLKELVSYKLVVVDKKYEYNSNAT